VCGESHPSQPPAHTPLPAPLFRTSAHPPAAHPPATAQDASAARLACYEHAQHEWAAKIRGCHPHGVADVLASEVWENISFGICQKT